MIDERSVVGREPRVTFRDLVRIMMDADLEAEACPRRGRGRSTWRMVDWYTASSRTLKDEIVPSRQAAVFLDKGG